MKALHGRRTAGQHAVAVKGTRLWSEVFGCSWVGLGEHVEGHVVSVGPDSELGVVAEIVECELIDGVATCRIRGYGDSDALSKRRPSRVCKLRQYPAVGRLVILGNRVAIIVIMA